MISLVQEGLDAHKTAVATEENQSCEKDLPEILTYEHVVEMSPSEQHMTNSKIGTRTLRYLQNSS